MNFYAFHPKGWRARLYSLFNHHYEPLTQLRQVYLLA